MGYTIIAFDWIERQKVSRTWRCAPCCSCDGLLRRLGSEAIIELWYERVREAAGYRNALALENVLSFWMNKVSIQWKSANMPRSIGMQTRSIHGHVVFLKEEIWLRPSYVTPWMKVPPWRFYIYSNGSCRKSQQVSKTNLRAISAMAPFEVARNHPGPFNIYIYPTNGRTRGFSSGKLKSTYRTKQIVMNEKHTGSTSAGKKNTYKNKTKLRFLLIQQKKHTYTQVNEFCGQTRSKCMVFRNIYLRTLDFDLYKQPFPRFYPSAPVLKGPSKNEILYYLAMRRTLKYVRRPRIQWIILCFMINLGSHFLTL